MPIGPFGEIIGTTGTLEGVAGAALDGYKTKVVAPRNPKLIRPGEQTDFKMKPSQFMFQMSMDTEQKLSNMHTMNVPQKVELLDMAETTHQKVSNVNIDEPMFQPFPSEVIFQNYEPFETYELPFILRNNDKVPRLVKVSQENSPYFKIISPHNVGHKVGPGLPTTFRVQFTPEQKEDYYHELLCTTEREKFVVPVRAIGARAILDFPDEVTFTESPVKYTTSRTLLVRNVGNSEAKFKLETNKPFTVSPINGTIPVNESAQITVDFNPQTVGDHHRDLVLDYHTGETIYIGLYGAANDALVRLDKNSIRIENTFLSMANQRTVTISNRSNVIAHYRWTQYATLEEEEQQKLMFCDKMEGEEIGERDRFLEECIADPSLRDKMSILSRTFQNKKRLVQDDKMVFVDDVIKIEPVEGDIWPNSSAEVQVIFKPESAEVYNRTAFCDITGRESRLPLRIRGDGIGPKVVLSYDELDMGNIFVNSTHTYEVVLVNKGDIDAMFSLVTSSSVFGACFQFNPSEGIVMPDGHQAIQITFSSAVLGDFQEMFEFQVDGSPNKLQLSFTGSVIGPTFHFDVPKLKFGTVSYGFVNTQTCTLANTALVPMKYTLRVPGDGSGESITSTSEYDSTLSDSGSSTTPPKEFEITPSSGTLEPSSEITIKVEVCSNTVKKYELAMVVDVEGVGDEILSLPITAKCVVPHITVLTPMLDYGRCFLRHPYEHHVKLQNDTDLPAKYELVPQNVDEFTPITYTSPQPKGILEPHSVTDVPMVITPQGLEELEVMAQFIIFGNPENPLQVHFTCIGEGPVVHVMPLDMDWGTIPVLVDMPRIVRLSNESLIPAKFTAHMVRPGSVWRVEPPQAEIPPERQMDIVITACVDDCVRFQDRLQINFLDGPSRSIPVTACGQGTTIVSDPPMTPTLNLGPHFSKGACKRTFTLTNKGRRHQSIVWNTEGFPLVQKPKRALPGLQPINPKDMKFRDMPPQPEPARPIFTVSPHRMELHPGQSCDVVLEGTVSSPQLVKEKMLCHAIIGRAGGKELIMKVQVNCEFITPLLEFSTDNLSFRIDKNPTDELHVQSKELEITNISSLPLTACLALPYPFQILLNSEDKPTASSQDEMYLGIGETRAVQIQFDPAYMEDSHIRIIDEVLKVTYKEHPHQDTIALRGEVYFPNLDFEKTEVDFGCILNDTEVTRYVNITNNSPMDVKYRWSFLIDGEPIATFHKSPTPTPLALEDIESQRSVSPESMSGHDEVMEVQVAIEGAESPREGPNLIEESMENEADILNVDEEKKDMMAVGEHECDVNTPRIVTDDGETQLDHPPEKGELDQFEKNLQGGRADGGQESRHGSRLDTPKSIPAINPALAALLDQDAEHLDPLGVEEIFDILPLYGTLKPGDMEQVTLTFYGHAHIGSQVKAICEVEGGPTYELLLKGEASLVQYQFDCLDIDYGKIMYDQVAVAEITLVNTGHVGLEFNGIGMDPGMAAKPKPGMPIMIPHAGFIEPHSELSLTLKFLPGAPERFHKSFQVQVAHFEPDTINLFGEGVFPRVSLDLPRSGGDEYDALVKEAREHLTKETKKIVSDRPMSGVSAQAETARDTTASPSELEVQMEVERLLVQEHAQAIQDEENNRPPDVLEVHAVPNTTTSQGTNTSRESKKLRRKTKPRPRLPEYVLDFGHVVLGAMCSHIVRATNTGWFPSSFSVDRENTSQYGFNIELDRVKQLPGAPDHETVDFVIGFDPRGANLGLGETETLVPINIVGGPQLLIHLKANVTMPDMQISTDVLDFSEVKCGECKVITVQLHNHKPVKCEWNSLPTEKDRQKELEKTKVDKHVPMHLRRKTRQEKVKPRSFEMMPPTGTLMPGQRQNVQVKFMPTEEKFYENRIAIRLAQSSQRLMLLCRGQGQEPHIEFDHNLIEFGPVLPHSAGDEQEVVIRNPCQFPLEIYNLEFDKGFLEEEKILRLMKGYDEYNTILLPPRLTGEKLPTELVDYYDEQMRKLEESERQRREMEEAAEAARREQQRIERGEEGDQETVDETPLADGARTDRSDVSKHTGVPEIRKDGEAVEPSEDKEGGVGELEVTPVSAAIARHLGIDLSPDGKAARNRRGISIIVHGAPLSGKTSSAVVLAKCYEAALLTVDGVVLEAICNGNTPAGLRARELCSEAAHRRVEELRALDGGEEAGKAATGGLSVEALTAHTQGTGSIIGQIAAAQSVAHSLVSNRKTSTISDQKSKDKHHSSTTGGPGGAKTAALTTSGESGSQVPSSPPPLAAPIARRLSISASIAGEEGLLSCVLPEDLLVEILAERLMLNDCHRGVVFDGLETLFSQNQYTTCHAILKALNNRKYIFMVTLRLQYTALKEKEKKAQEEAEANARQQEEEERVRLEEMSEDEYDALGDEEKAGVDKKRLEIKKERLRREQEERQEREKREREAWEAEQRRLEEERAKGKKSKRGTEKDGKDTAKKTQGTGGKAAQDAKSVDRVGHPKSQEGKKVHDSEHNVGKSTSGGERPESHATEKGERGESAAEEGRKKKEKAGKDGKRPVSNEGQDKRCKGKGSDEDAPCEEPQKDPKTEADLLLMQRFRTFEHSYKEIYDLADHWERGTASIHPITPLDGMADQDDSHNHPPSGRKAKKGDKHEKGGKETDKKADKASKEAAAKEAAKEQAMDEGDEGASDQMMQLSEEERREKRFEDGIGVPHLVLECTPADVEPPTTRVMDFSKLPSMEEVMDGLGLGPHGPPIPPAAIFSVVPYPVKRHAPPGADGGHYTFVASSPDDPNVSLPDDKSKDDEQDDDKSVTPDGRKEDTHPTPTKGGKASKADKLSGNDKKDKRKSSAKSRAGRRSSMQTVSPPPGAPTPASETEGSTTETALHEPKTPKLQLFRWVIPAEGEVVLRLRFTSEDLGQFDQTLNFEILGTRRRYQLYCRGICAFPTISREPRIVFPHRKKSKKSDEIVHKKYILTNETFEYGPLLVGKSRDKYKEGKYPENMEKLMVLNTSPLEADISFCFLNDSKGETYLLDPPTMILKPNQSQELSIWAYPKVPGVYEDALVCCVKENPEPIMFKLLSYGVLPELELDKKVLHFDKVLLHRKDTKTLYLRNSTLLPVAWRLNLLENLGDDFSVSQESGIIEPKSEFALHAYFRAMKPVNTKKAIRLEVSDADNIRGLLQSENIQVHAEAYDVALDMSFPKGADGGIDFDVIRVMDEQKQTCSLKNKGKYDIGYIFSFEPTESCPQSICDMFSVIPNRGTLSPVDRPAQVQVIFRSTCEVLVKEQPILRCQVIEPNIGDEGETIASIPIKLSVKSVFSKYKIFPVNDINFGAMLVNSRKTRTFTIENKGERFDFKYTITRVAKETTKHEERRSRPTVKGDKRSKSRDGSSSGRSGVRPKRAESIRQEMGGGGGGGGPNQSRLVLGMFNVFPAFGYILPGGHQVITVDCVAENAGKSEEEICIDITGRDPADHSSGIPYKLIAEACVPSINVSDLGSIFEEHRVCKNLSLWEHTNSIDCGGVFGEDENKFIFNNVLVGAKSRARFKITNTNKVPCDVLFTAKPVVTKASTKTQEVFEVDPPRAQIAAHSHMYAIMCFTPLSMQHYSATFEAAIEGVPQNMAKGRNLTFEVAGEGNLPRISILKPCIHNKKGQSLLLFKRLLVGRLQSLPILIKNGGNLPSKVDIDMVDPDSVFTLQPKGDTRAVMSLQDAEPSNDGGRKRPHAASVVIDVGETATFDVIYQPMHSLRSQGQVRLTVVNNQYEDSVVQLVGEGYVDDITLENIPSLTAPTDPEQHDGNMADDDVQAAKCNLIKFGDCFINEQRTLSFTMTNHSETDCIRFVWPEDQYLKFSPQVGHLHGGCSKDIVVTFQADAPKSMEEQEIPCKITKITFDKPTNEVAEWDDRVKTVKWVDATVPQVPSGNASDSGKPGSPVPMPTSSQRPVKKKVVETEPEPAYHEVAESGRTVDLLVSAHADNTKYKCKVESVHFRDTLMLQTRVYEFQVSNKGSVRMDYNWQVLMESLAASTHGPRSVTFAADSRPPTAAPLVARSDDIRPNSAASSIISDVAYTPFDITPTSGSVLPGKKINFCLKFSPLDVNEYDARLICSIPNLEEGKQGPVIAVKARSLMPYCHFELEDSDYIRSARRNPELRGPGGAPPGTTLDPNTRVIELTNVGVGVKNMRRFDIVNPTNQDYTFSWLNEDEPNPKKTCDFHCVTPHGLIRSGKKTEVVFEFVSSGLELVESFWRFSILEQSISVPFLLVGNTLDPAVTLDRSHLNFKSLLIGHEAEETVTLFNSEQSPFSFSFVEMSCHAPGNASSLIVQPMHGIIPAKSSMPVRIRFTPTTDKEVNFNLQCNIKRKTTSLTLNVKAEGYSMDVIVMCEDSVGNKVELSSAAINKINFGDVEVNERAIRNIYIVNAGKFNFDYTFELQDRWAEKDDIVAISPITGGVPHGDRVQTQLSFCPPKPMALRSCQLTLKISNGPSYGIQASGNGVMPGLAMSFTQHNFGPCFIHRAGMPVHTATLRLSNTDKREISVDCLYPSSKQLHHDFQAQVINPQASIDVPFTFYPREARRYSENVVFEINGLSKQTVEFIGLGTDMKVEVADPKHKIIKFGALRVAQQVKKIIPVVNNSPAPITFHLGMTPSLTLLQDKSVLKLLPAGDIVLPPKGGTAKIEVIFSPKTRIPQFTEEVLLECAGLFQPLFVITGACQGIEIKLDTDAIPFGAVVQKSSSARKLVMANTGDIGARFKWDIKKFAPDFSISPTDGYISPGMDVPFDVVFHPQEISNDIRYENLRCSIEGAKALRLTLTGTCVAVPPSREAVHFNTHVRQKECKNIMVPNRTNQHWNLRPIIDGDCWAGPDTFSVEPQTTKPYELVYQPMTMTSEGKKHAGTVFFPLPDGTGLLYNVTGSADPPRVNSKISRDVPCKTSFTELLNVQNWLKKPQRFRVKTECIRPDKLDPGTTVKGLDYIDVPGNTKRDYKLTFYAHKEGQSIIKVMFINESTGEYQFYEVTFRGVRPGVISAIDLVTPVRQSVPYTIRLENPLSYAVTFAATCSVSEILMPNQLSVPANSEGAFNFEYLPLKVGEQQSRLEFLCNDLGLYMFDLNLKATPAGPERALYFRTCLGTSQMHVAKYLNFAKQKTDYGCKVDNSDFHVDKTVAAAPGSSSGTEVVVEVTYEPSRIGESRGVLTVSSASGGDYTFPLFGTCVPPKPQGPFIIKAGSTTSITFRNVFQHTTPFVFQVDNPLFHVTKPGENVRHKKDHRVVVGFDGNDSGSKAAVMGKLTISCAKSAGGFTNAQWVFYLKGVTPDR